MKKINFTNATVTAQASVEIDGVSHDVTPAVIEGGTLPTPDNMNQLQNNVEEAILNPVVESIKSENQFNKDDCVDYYYLDYNNGQPVVDINMSYMKSYIPVKPNEKYTMSYSSSTIFVVYEYDSNKTFLRNKRQNTDATSFTVTISEDAYFVRLACGYGPKPGIVFAQGDTAVPYTPFKRYGYNSQESMGSIVVDDIRSKNKFNMNGNILESIGYTSGTNTLESGKIKSTANFANGNGKGQIIQLKPNTVYTYSVKISSFEVSGSTSLRISPVNSEGNAVGYLVDQAVICEVGKVYSYSFTTSDTGKIWVMLNGISNVEDYSILKYVVYDYIQIEEGSTATNYSEYKKLDTDIYSFDTNLTYNSSSPQSFQNAILKNAKLVVCNFHSTDGNWDIQTQHLTSGTSFTSMQTSTNWYVASNFDSTLGKITFLTKSDNSNFVLNKITVVK